MRLGPTDRTNKDVGESKREEAYITSKAKGGWIYGGYGQSSQVGTTVALA